MRKSASVVFVIGMLAWLAYHATGSRYGGGATAPNEIPIVGESLSELVFIEPAVFHGYEHPHGGGTFVITGTATHDSVVNFCDSAGISLSQDGTEIAGRDDILAYLKNREVKLPESFPDQPPDVLFGYGTRFPRLYGVYNAVTNRFAIALQFHRLK